MCTDNPTNIVGATTSPTSTLSPSTASCSPPQSTRIMLTSLTWNLEGMKRNLASLKHITEKAFPDLIFISEPSIFTSDLRVCMSLFRCKYCWELNSEDRYDQEAAMTKSRTIGGTMTMWKASMDKYVTVSSLVLTSFLPVILSLPGCPVSVHIALYLPTAGREAEYVEQLALLSNCIKELRVKYEDCLIFIRGDGNTNPKNKERMKLFTYFLSSYNLGQIKINHCTYHHFLGGGAFDSNIDVILQSENVPDQESESVVEIFCSKELPDMFSHHDAILSQVTLTSILTPAPDQELVSAPRVNHQRTKITWSEKGIADYQATVGHDLAKIRSI